MGKGGWINVAHIVYVYVIAFGSIAARKRIVRTPDMFTICV